MSAPPERVEEPVSAGGPEILTREGPCYDPIVVCLDGSPLAERALAHAEALAGRFDARLIVVRVVSPLVEARDLYGGDATLESYEDVLERQRREARESEIVEAREYVERLAGELGRRGVRAEAWSEVGDPASAIVGLVAKLAGRLVVMGTHGRSGLSRLALGSVAERVIRGSAVPVLLVRAP
jgi:nucleotide-binding universal stress UspA family protein